MSFRLNLIIRIFILVLLLFGLVYSLLKGRFFLTGLTLLVFVVVSIYNLIQYVESSNRQMAHFLEVIRYNDFVSLGSGRQKGDSFEQLQGAFQAINHKFLEIRAEKEANHQFLQMLMGNIGVGLMVWNEKEEVIMLNAEMKRLLQKPHLVNKAALADVAPELYEVVESLSPGQKRLIRISVKGTLLQLSVHKTSFRQLDAAYEMILLQDIRNELEAQEFAAWQKLIRILTHEIMNSVAPIASLSGSMEEVLEGKQSLHEGDIHPMRRSLEVIKRRSENLLSFTETYRNLTRLPIPQFREAQIGELLRGIQELFQQELSEQSIHFEANIPTEQISVQADPALLEQVLINLMRNAIEAVDGVGQPNITLGLRRLSSQQLEIRLQDNGNGIPDEDLEKIFVPFFTTKDNGSGIGLSLSRQIMMMHKGSISIQSRVEEGTLVKLIL
ncbi:MAG: ATP-binding protein [Bacteroidota bacterium]